jgi:hypothetical protein
MSIQKKLGVSLLLLVVGVIYFYLYGGYFMHREIPIHVTVRPRVMRRRPQQNVDPNQPLPTLADFNLGGAFFQLTSIEVYSVDALATNKDAAPVWHLVSDSNSIPVGNFVYGWPIKGMHPAINGARPGPLEPDSNYRVIIKARHRHGEHDFKTPPPVLPPPGNT